MPFLVMPEGLPAWPQRVYEILRDAVSELLPSRASLQWSLPTGEERFWQISLIPTAQAATALHLFLNPTADDNDTFEVGSRSASFELWEEPEVRTGRIRQIAVAVITGRCSERVRFVGNEPARVEVTFELNDGPTTYTTLIGRGSRPRRGPERIENQAFAPY